MNMETITIGETTYTLKRRLAWLEQEQINELQYRMFVDGRQLAQTDDLSRLEAVEIRQTEAEQNLARLRARVVSVDGHAVTQGMLRALALSHVRCLIARIRELEQEEEAEIAALMPGNPTATPSGD